jgi:hypothetical protein
LDKSTNVGTAADGCGEQPAQFFDGGISLASPPFAQAVEQYGGVFRAVAQQC